jgi:hypothetical protein
MIKKEITENGLIADLFTDNSTQPEKARVMLWGSEGGKSWCSSPVILPIHMNHWTVLPCGQPR